MWARRHQQRCKAKKVTGGGYEVRERGEVGRRSAGLTDASRRFLESLGKSVPDDFEGLARSVHGEPVASLGVTPGKVRRWQDMTEAEREAIRQQYEGKAKR